MAGYEFDAVIEEGRGGGAWVEVPSSIYQEFGTRGRVKVRASFDGEPYRGSIAPMGGMHILGVAKAIRAAIGKEIGAVVHVVLEEDTAERVVEVPPDLQAALDANPRVKERFARLAYTHRKEYARAIAEARKEETRARRLRALIEKLS